MVKSNRENSTRHRENISKTDVSRVKMLLNGRTFSRKKVPRTTLGRQNACHYKCRLVMLGFRLGFLEPARAATYTLAALLELAGAKKMASISHLSGCVKRGFARRAE